MRKKHMLTDRLTIARTLVVLGFLVGLNSLLPTFGHIGDPAYLVSADFGGGPHHSWYHALREGMGDIAKLVAILFIFFGAAQYRNQGSWWVCLILMLGYYLPFWAGMPFVPELRAPGIGAELNHIGQAVLALAGLCWARPVFMARGQ
jgi:hypothetical protein